MNSIILKGVKPYDGRYELDLVDTTFNTIEYGWIKRFSGWLPGDIDKGFRGADAELITTFGVIALHRAGRIDERDADDVWRRLAEGPFGTTVTLDLGQTEEDDADPPAQKTDERSSSSGQGSSTSSETSPNPRNGSGTPDSDTSAWHPARSGG